MIVRKRFLAALMAFCLALTLLPGTALAATVATGECGAKRDNLTWTLDNGGTLTVYGNGEMEDYTTQMSGGPVPPWEKHSNSIKNVDMDSGITHIGNSAFLGLHYLNSAKIPYSVVTIGKYAFYRCNRLISISLPYGMENIGTGAFLGCDSLTDVEIPNSVTSLGSSAFCECDGLTSVTLSNKLTSIETATFQRCYSLTSVTIPDSVTSMGHSGAVDKVPDYSFTREDSG